MVNKHMKLGNHKKDFSKRKLTIKVGKRNITFDQSEDGQNQLLMPNNSAHLKFTFSKDNIDEKQEYISSILDAAYKNGGVYSINILATYFPLLKPMLAAVLAYKNLNKELKIILSPESKAAIEEVDPDLLKKFNNEVANIEASDLRYNEFNVMHSLSINHSFSEVELKIYMYLFGKYLRALTKKSVSYLAFNYELICKDIGEINNFSRKDICKAADKLRKRNIISLKNIKGKKYFWINSKGPILV